MAGSTLGTPVRSFRIFSLAVTTAELFGTTERGEFIPGIISAAWEKHNRSDAQHAFWLVVDGPLDPSWPTGLLSALDGSSRALTLPNGDRIPAQPSTRVLFETDSL
jgi:hypothetical protein